MQNSSDRYTESSDISFVDLTVIVVRWKKLFFAAFLGLVLLSVGYAFIAPEKQASVGLYQLGKAGDGEYLTDVASVVSTMSSVWIPELMLEYESKGHSAPSVSVSNPKNTGLIRLQTLAPVGQEQLVATIHEDLLNRLNDWQSTVYQDAVSRIERRAGQHTDVIDQMLEDLGQGEAVSVLMQDRIELEHQLDQMKSGQILTIASQGDDAGATSRSLTIVVGLLVAFVLATLLCFAAEFVEVVRKRAMVKP